MSAKKAFDDKALFEEKYALYGDMLYKLGIIYLGVGNDNQMCQEAIDEAFLWLLTRKKRFKNPERERMELIRHMVLICDSKSRREPKRASVEEDDMSENAFCSESMDMLESAYSLPSKYKPILHLALYENLDVRHIYKILYITRPIVKKLLAKGIELMEMVLERKLDREYYCSMLDECQTPSDIKEKVYLYLTEGKPHVKTYLSPIQKRTAALAAIAAAALFITAIHFYPIIKPVVRTKYAFMKGTIRSITLNRIRESNVPGVLFAYSGNGYQGYTLSGKSLEQLETKHITKTIDYAGQQFEVNFYCCTKDDRLAVFYNMTHVINDTYVYISPINNSNESVLLNLHYYNEDNGFTYPLIMDINTLHTTDLLAGCRLSDISNLTDVKVNDNLSGAIAITRDGSIYYCNIKSSSITEIPNYGDNPSNSGHFSNDETVIYSNAIPKALGTGCINSFYEYSTNTNTSTKCYEFDSTNGQDFFYGDGNTVLLKNSDNTYSIVDIRTGDSDNVPNMQEEDSPYPLTRYSPDGRYVLFEYSVPYLNTSQRLTRIYIYDRETKRTSILNLKEYKSLFFSSSFWYDNNHIALLKRNLEPSNNNTPSPETEHPSTLWIFDINKLK